MILYLIYGKLNYLTNDTSVSKSGEKFYVDYLDPKWVEKELPWLPSLYVQYPTIQDLTTKEITTLDDYYQVLKAYKSKYPDKNHYAISMDSESGEGLIVCGLFMNGYKIMNPGSTNSFVTKDGKDIMYNFKAPEVLDYMKFLNKLYTEGLMDPEGPIQKADQLQQKLNSGKVFSLLNGYSYIYTANDTLGAAVNTKDMSYIPQKLQAPGVMNVWQYNIAYTGANAFVILKSCKDPARVMRFFEGMYTNLLEILNAWGILNEDYVINAQGKRDYNAEIDKKNVADPDLAKKRGLKALYGMMNAPLYATDGQPYSNDAAQYYKDNNRVDSRDKVVSASPFNWHNDWSGTFWKDYNLEAIYVPADTPAATGIAKADALVNDAVSQMVLAKSSNEVENIYKDTLAKMEQGGISTWEKEAQKIIGQRINEANN